jgi:glutamate 5-kinase
MSDRIDQIKNPRRIVVKIGTNVLIDDSGQLDLELIENLVSDIASVHQQGIEVVIVTSGAIAFGANMLGIDMENQDVRSKQALAAVGQSRLMHAYEQIFETHNIVVAQALISRSDITDREGYLNVRNTLVTLMDFNTVPIINENDVVALEEIGVKVFGDNDNLSSMVSNLIDADLLILLSDIDGLHTMDPHRHPDAELVLEVDTIDESIEAMAGISHSSRSKGGMQAKLDAIKLATASGIAVVLVNGRNPSVVSAVLAGKNV